MKTYQAGIDVGSTTVKLVVLDENGQMIFGQYQRHLSHTQRALSDLLKQARAALGECALELRATGSGAINLAKALGRKPTWDDLQIFLKDRCVPQERDGLKYYLSDLGLDCYDPLAIIRKTEGRMAEDSCWIKIVEG